MAAGFFGAIEMFLEFVLTGLWYFCCSLYVYILKVGQVYKSTTFHTQLFHDKEDR